MCKFSHRLAFRPCGSKPGFQVIAFRVQSLHGSGATAAKAIDLHLAFNRERLLESAFCTLGHSGRIVSWF